MSDKYSKAVEDIRDALDPFSPEERRRVIVAALELEGLGVMLRKDDKVLSEIMAAIEFQAQKEGGGK